MPKIYFHNDIVFKEHKNKEQLYQNSNIDKKKVVDVNVLLNKVKIKEKNEIKKKIIFFSFVTILLGIFATSITIIK